MALKYGWLDLSTPTRPSYALVCGHATGKEEWQIVKRNDMFMTADQAILYDKTHFKLMTLPFDLRHEILTHVCDEETMPVFLRRGFHGMPPTAVPIPKLAHAGNRKLRVETILVKIKQTILEIHSGPGNAKLQKWLASIDISICGETSLKSAFEAVHALSFPYFSRYPHAALATDAPNNDIQLMLKCENLCKLHLHFAYQELVYYDINGFEHSKSIERLRREYRLNSMIPVFKLGELRTVIFQGPFAGSAAHDSLQALAAWFRDEYAVHANPNIDTDITAKAAKALQVAIE